MTDSETAPEMANAQNSASHSSADASASNPAGAQAAAFKDPSVPEFFTDEIFADDQLSLKHTAIGMCAAVVGGAALAFVAWFVLHRLSLPAFGGSLLTRAVSSAGSVLVLVAATVLLYFFSTSNRTTRARPLELATYVVAYLAPAALVVTALAIPLGSTRLYLDGISVDQEFRTEYLTRMAAEFGLHDMSYIDVAAFYPAGWFFLGGRFANLLGITGWEAFQPWALVTLAAAGSLLVPVWQRLSGSLPVAAAIALVTTALTLSTTADEPYAAVIAMGLPALAVLASRGLSGAWSAMAGVIVFLGISATFYTLFTAVGALIVVAMTVVVCARHGSWKPVLRLIIMGAGSAAIALTVWFPYLLAVATGQPRSGGTATHYLPGNGAQIPLPMFAASAIGLLCFLGVVWFMSRAMEPDTRALGVALLVMYAWAVASMIATLGGQTLLGFRLEAPITMLLAAGGVFAIADAKLNEVERFWPQAAPRHIARNVSAVLALVVVLLGINYAQSIPQRLHGPIDLAHTDTDGFGQRADKFAPNAGRWYADIDKTLRDGGLEPSQSVVLSDERNFQAFYPWYSFQALTSHYANPLGEFDQRNAAIEQWATLKSADELIASMDADAWRGPDAIVVRGDLDDAESSFTIDVADDIYPNNPNVLFRGIALPQKLFSVHWSKHQVGPFVVLIRDTAAG